MIKHMLVGTDGSPAALYAVKTAAEIASRIDAKLTLVYVRPLAAMSGFSSVPLTEEYIDVEEAEFEKKRDIIVEPSREACDNLNVKFDFMTAQGAVGEALEVLAKNLKVDLIVVGHRGLNALQSFFLGSTAEHVVKTANCSVLVVR